MPMVGEELQRLWAADLAEVLVWCEAYTNDFQSPAEYAALFRYAAGWLCPAECDAVVEIGSYEGQTDVVLSRALETRRRRLGLPAEALVAVDPCEGLEAVNGQPHGIGWLTFAEWHAFLRRHDAYGQVVPLVATTAQALPLLRRFRARMMLIDGDHFLPAVRMDADLADEIVAPGGVALFHDCDRADRPNSVHHEVEPEAWRLVNSGRWALLERMDSMMVLEKTEG